MAINSLQIEIRLNNATSLDPIAESELIEEAKQNIPEFIENFHSFSPLEENCKKFSGKIDRILVCCSKVIRGELLHCTKVALNSARYFLYTANNYGEMAEELTLGGDVGGGESPIGTFQWELPVKEFDGLWESLIYGVNGCPKEKLMNFILTSLKFARCGVDPQILSRNHLILMNGPPGTGKTTLCKAVAQRMAIRVQRRFFKQTLLVEVNSHSLFSKWFSESGKLIQKLFSRIEELAEHADRLVFVLIDEVESLAMGRETSVAGNDPTDSIRAVNAVLTQLDRMKRFPNVFILCTSNIESALDAAFVDRVGLSLHIGRPCEEAITAILKSCIEEMKRVVGLIVDDKQSLEWWTDEVEANVCKEISKRCLEANISGREVRKLPANAYARALQKLEAEDAGSIDRGAEAVVTFSSLLLCLYDESAQLAKIKAEKGSEKGKESSSVFDFDSLLGLLQNGSF